MGKSYITRRYGEKDHVIWDDFVARAKNATFLFNRGFMDYHSDRFDDYSLLVFDGKKLCAVVPANLVNGEVCAHQGLTYAGIVFLKGLKFSNVLGVYKSILQFLESQKIQRFVIKVVPRIYCTLATDELDYLLFLTDAQLLRRDLSITIDQVASSKIQSNRMEGVKKGVKNQLIIKEDLDLEAFWKQVLIPNLKERYDSAPTHSYEEIAKLAALFPENIRQFNVYHQEAIVAGATMFVSKTVAHVQYISAIGDKQQLGSLDFLFHYLIKEVFCDKQYFDLGTSSENSGRSVNSGLLYWKECFGGNGNIQDTYEVETANHVLLDTVL